MNNKINNNNSYYYYYTIKCDGFLPGHASLAYFFFLGILESSNISSDTVHDGNRGVGTS